MGAHRIASFDRTIALTDQWLQQLEELMNWEDRQRAYHGLRAVLHALRDRLSVDEATDLAAQLPMLIRGFFFEGWHPAGKPLKQRTEEEFLESISEKLDREPTTDPRRLATAVFTVLQNRITAGEIEDVKVCLPAEIRALWP